MEFTEILIFQFIAHFLADFIFQSNDQAKDKNILGFKSSFLKWHFLIVFGLSWILSFQLNFVLVAFIIAITHYIIDGFKKHINNHKKLGKYAFFIDQTLHLIIIIIAVCLFDKYFYIYPLINFEIDIKYLLMILAYLFCLKPANIFVKQVFNVFDVSTDTSKDLENAGRLIGILERLLVLTFILINQFEAVGFLIAAKSILRFKDNDTTKTEYVLIGTMLSFGIAVALGVIINSI